MQELTPQEFESSSLEEVNLEAVEFYLLVTDDKMRQLAASMHSQPGKLDPGEIPKQAEKLVLGSIGAAKRSRQRLLLSMNQNTLIELAGRLFEPDQLFEYSYISGAHESFVDFVEGDPIRGPAFAILRQRGLLPKPPDEIRKEKMITASADTRAPCPDLPCELEAALRWAANAPDVSFKTLNRAFFDWTTTTIKIANMRAKSLETYRSSFKPGETKTPKKLAAYVKDFMTSKSGTLPKVRFEEHLLDFATEFRPFWEKHAAAYEAHAKNKSSTNKASGVGGPNSHMRKNFECTTDNFVGFCEGRTIPIPGSDDWDGFFREFGESQPYQPRTQSKKAVFVKTLLVRAAEPESDGKIADIIKLLKAEGIKAVDPKTIRSCLEKLKAVP